jgi:Rod binding domain-containing protein
MAASAAIPGIPAAADVSVALDRQANAQLNRMRAFTTADPQEADRVSRDFEAMFLSNMLQPVFAGIKSSKGFFGGGHAEDTFQSMLVDEYGKVMAKAGGVGIAKMVRDQILKLQEVA